MIVRVYNFLSAEKPKFSQNLVGIVSDVTSFKYTRRAYDIGSFEMVVPTHADEAGCIQPDRMLIVGEKLGQTYIASDPTKRIVKGIFLYVTDIEKKDDKITVTGYDLKYLFALRVTLFPKEEQDKGTYGYYVTSGTTFSCISDIINYNIVNATDSDRKIYGMFGITMPVDQINAEPPLTGIQDDRYMTRLEPVSTAIFNLLKNCKTHFYDMRLIIDDNAEDGDNYNPHMESSEDKPTIIIDESRYNIKSYARKDGTSAYKNAIYAVVGSGDAVTVKCVKRPDDTASGVKRKEVVLDVDTDSVAEIDRYALKAAEEYVISDDFEIEPLFMDDEAEPELAQKVSIRIDGIEYNTVITEITDEYANGKHTQSYVCGDKKLKVLNVLNKATAGNTQKIIDNKINIGNKGGVGKICGNGTSEQFNDYSTANIDEITRYSHIVGRNNTITGGDYDTIIGKGNTIKNVLSNSEKGYQGTRYGQGSVVTGTSNTTVQSVNTLVSGRNNYVGRSYWNPAIDSLVVGSSNKINGGMDSSAVIGNANTTPSSENTDIISLSGSIVVGNENKIESGDIVASTIIGDGNNAKLRVTAKNVNNSMQNSVIIGTGNTNESVQGAYTIGHLNHQYSSSPAIITGKGQFAIGVGLNNGRPNNFVMGYYNKKYENGKELDLPFSFGGGTSDDDRKNLIELDWNGNLWIAGNLNEGGGGYVLPIATKSTLGGVKIGDNLTISEDGTLSANVGEYTLPVATADTLGGIKVGNNLSIAADGTLSAEAQPDIASASKAGVVKVGENIDVTADGTISIPAPCTLRIDNKASANLVHKYVPVTASEEKIYYGDIDNSIICNGYTFWRNGMTFSDQGIFVDFSPTLMIKKFAKTASGEIIEDCDFQVALVNVDSSIYAYKSYRLESKKAGLTTTSTYKHYSVQFDPIIFPTWKSIIAPTSEHPYGRIQVTLSLMYVNSSNKVATGNSISGYIDFATEAEYNAAVCLTHSSVRTTRMEERTNAFIIPSSISLVTDTLPETGEEDVLYLIYDEDTAPAMKEYLWHNGAWRYLGTTDVDLSEYLKSTDISDWAKAATKPTYTAKEVGAATAADITAAINAISIGGRNIAIGTASMTPGANNIGSWNRGTWRSSQPWGTLSVVEITDSPVEGNSKAARLTVSDVKGSCCIMQQFTPLVKGQQYVLSCWIRGTAPKAQLEVYYGTPVRGGLTTVNVTSQWQKVYATCGNTEKFNVPQETKSYTASTVYILPQNVGDYIEVCGLKLEKGKKPTDWSPAPEDAERRITALEARVAALEAAAVSGGEV